MNTDDEASQSLEAALDGILNAVEYCDSRGLQECSEDLNALYQKVARQSPDEDWEAVDSEDDSLEFV